MNEHSGPGGIDVDRAGNWLSLIQCDDLIIDLNSFVQDIEKEHGELFLTTNFNSGTSSYAEIFLRDPSGRSELVETTSGIQLARYSGIAILIPLAVRVFAITEHRCCIKEGRVINDSPVTLSSMREECSTADIEQLKEKFSSFLRHRGYVEVPLAELSLPFQGTIAGDYPFDHSGLRLFDVLFQNIY